MGITTLLVLERLAPPRLRHRPRHGILVVFATSSEAARVALIAVERPLCCDARSHCRRAGLASENGQRRTGHPRKPNSLAIQATNPVTTSGPALERVGLQHHSLRHL